MNPQLVNATPPPAHVCGGSKSSGAGCLWQPLLQPAVLLQASTASLLWVLEPALYLLLVKLMRIVFTLRRSRQAAVAGFPSSPLGRELRHLHAA